MHSGEQNPECSFIKRGDHNDCAHAGGGRGAKDAWCESCKALYYADALRDALRLLDAATNDEHLAECEWIETGDCACEQVEARVRAVASGVVTLDASVPMFETRLTGSPAKRPSWLDDPLYKTKVDDA